tara:strand:+ start:533 stop:1048 length:516 start_codon:yes stop_codon:yes gene_type:complete
MFGNDNVEDFYDDSIPDDYYDTAHNIVWDFGEGISDWFIEEGEKRGKLEEFENAISPALTLIEMNKEYALAKLLWNLQILEPVSPIEENHMKLTKRQLRRIIKEEKQKLLREASMDQAYAYASDLVQDAIAKLALQFSEEHLQSAADNAHGSRDRTLFELLTAASLAATQK